MAVQNQTPIASFTTSGVTTVFPFAFMLLDADDLVVTLDGVTVSSGFVIAGIGAPAGGSVVFTIAPDAGQMLVLRRNIALQRLNDYQRNGDLLAQVLNLDLDRIWQALQGLRLDATRALKLPEDTLTDQTITDDATERAGKLVGFDSSGNVTVVEVSTPGALLVSAFIESLLPAANAAAARLVLGAVGTSGTDTIAGVKTFTSPPVIPDALDPQNPVSKSQLESTASSITRLAVRQTVLSGPVTGAGMSNFGGSTGSTTVTASGTLIATSANGFGETGNVDRVGTIVDPSWTGLSATGTMYLYLDIAADGTCTTGSTTLAPAYQWGGSYSTLNGQFTFSISEMVGKVGNGSTAVQTHRVFVGEVTVAAGVVSAITWYGLRGRYDSGYTNTLPSAGTLTSKNTNLGVVPMDARIVIECLTAEFGYAVGDTVVSALAGYNGTTAYPSPVVVSRNTMSVTTGSTTAWGTNNKNTGTNTGFTLANWKYKFIANRGW